MSDIKDIESIIRKIISTNESIVTTYDSKLLCEDHENTWSQLYDLYISKKELMESLETSMNEFFCLEPNLITKILKINSFKLIPTFLNFELKFSLPKSVDKTSRQYFCYITMMDRLTNEYDSVNMVKGEYFLLDIAAGLNLEKVFKEKLNVKN